MKKITILIIALTLVGCATKQHCPTAVIRLDNKGVINGRNN